MRRPRMLETVLLAGLVLLAACGGAQGDQADPGGEQAAACAPAGAALRVAADNTAFDTDCLAAGAGRAFTIQFDNQDAVSHNVAIYTSAAAEQALFKGEIIEGGKTTTYRVPPLEPGTYFFRCDVHPQQMTGTFVVR